MTQIQGTGFNYAVVNTNSQTVNYNLFTEVTTTNDMGDYFQVLEGMNDGLGGFYRYESGTSMAAADVSGTLALMQDFFTNTLQMTPSPALLKAMLINGARPTLPSYNMRAGNPINNEGWGLINLPNSLPTNAAATFIASGSTPASMFIQDQSPTNALATGDSLTRSGSAARRWLAVTKRVPGAMTYCTPNSVAAVHQLGPLMDVACIQQLSLNPETIAAVRHHGGTVYFYTSAYDGDRLPDRLRFLNGLFLFKSGATALFYWHYQYPVGDPLNDLDGATCDYNLCHPSAAGPISTLGWEAIREGNNDVAYLHCLTHGIGRARSSGNAEAQAVAERAEQWLDATLKAVVVDGARVHKPLSPPIPHRSYDQHRFRTADFAIRILQTLGKLSSAERKAAEAIRQDSPTCNDWKKNNFRILSLLSVAKNLAWVRRDPSLRSG